MANKRYWLYFSIGLVLCIISLPPVFLMTMEMVYRSYVENRYEIKNEYAQMLSENEFDPYHPFETPIYKYQNNKVDIMLVPKRKLTPAIFAGDVDIYLNGKLLTIIWNRVLKSNNPDTPEEPATFDPSSASDVSVYVLKDNLTNEEDIIIFAEVTAYEIKASDEYLDHRYYPYGMDVMSRFEYWRIHKDGTYKKESFQLAGDRTYLQTFLARKNGILIGQYTSLNDAYPVFYFPFSYPFFTGILGIFLIFIALKGRHKKKLE